VLAAGVAAHQVHGAQVQRASSLGRWGMGFVAAALILSGLLLVASLLL
jgi:hypothetical protein